METPTTDRRIEILQFLFDNDEIKIDEIRELVELKQIKQALSIGAVVQQRKLLIAYEIAMHSCLESEPFRTKYAEKVVDDFISKQ